MKKKNSYWGYLILIIVFILFIVFSNPARASTPEIYSITPNMGGDEKSTYVTINGANFQPTPTVALYGGELGIIGSCDTPDDACGVHVEGSYAYVADENSGFQVIDISDPSNPAIVGSCDTPGLCPWCPCRRLLCLCG